MNRQLRSNSRSCIRIGIDLMGGDVSPLSLLEAVSAIPRKNDVEFVLIGSPELEKSSQLPFCPAEDVVFLGDSPVAGVKKKRSSMMLGLELLQKKKIDAFVSAGNTSALVLGAKRILSSFPKIARPAFVSFMPTKKKPVAVLDLGANVQCRAKNFVQFAFLAAALLETKGIDRPKIGLLNIGEEPLKGTSELRIAYQLLAETKGAPFQFVGNIEGKSVFEGEADAIVTDGFTGNIFLKTAEGVASLVLDRMYASIPQESAEALRLQLRDLQAHLHYAEYPGALLIGVQGIVIKCHGYSTPRAFVNGVLGAEELVRSSLLEKLTSKFV